MDSERRIEEGKAALETKYSNWLGKHLPNYKGTGAFELLASIEELSEPALEEALIEAKYGYLAECFFRVDGASNFHFVLGLCMGVRLKRKGDMQDGFEDL